MDLVTGKLLERSVEIIRRTDLDGMNLDCQCRSSGVDVLAWRGVYIGDIDQEPDPGHTRYQFLRKLHILPAKSIDVP